MTSNLESEKAECGNSKDTITEEKLTNIEKSTVSNKVSDSVRTPEKCESTEKLRVTLSDLRPIKKDEPSTSKSVSFDDGTVLENTREESTTNVSPVFRNEKRMYLSETTDYDDLLSKVGSLNFDLTKTVALCKRLTAENLKLSSCYKLLREEQIKCHALSVEMKKSLFKESKLRLEAEKKLLEVEEHYKNQMQEKIKSINEVQNNIEELSRVPRKECIELELRTEISEEYEIKIEKLKEKLQETYSKYMNLENKLKVEKLCFKEKEQAMVNKHKSLEILFHEQKKLSEEEISKLQEEVHNMKEQNLCSSLEVSNFNFSFLKKNIEGIKLTIEEKNKKYQDEVIKLYSQLKVAQSKENTYKEEVETLSELIKELKKVNEMLQEELQKRQLDLICIKNKQIEENKGISSLNKQIVQLKNEKKSLRENFNKEILNMKEKEEKKFQALRDSNSIFQKNSKRELDLVTQEKDNKITSLEQLLIEKENHIEMNENAFSFKERGLKDAEASLKSLQDENNLINKVRYEVELENKELKEKLKEGEVRLEKYKRDFKEEKKLLKEIYELKLRQKDQVKL
eukprot:augustus_masked-scaffold_11-processed-gene-0.30-mRNA-1 protein AED:1.00 eAED:1.00 QI:0/-1/0/0/-1/1/1/0/569